MEEMTLSVLALSTYLLVGMILLGAPLWGYTMLVRYLNSCWNDDDDLC